MSNIKLIATDLDGTFLMNGDQPHPDNVEALRACQRAGIIFCACTGRMWYEARHIVESCGFDDYCVTNNGASIMNIKTGQHQFRRRIDPQYLKQIIKVAVERKASVSIKGYDSVYKYGPLMVDAEREWMERVGSDPAKSNIKTYVMETVEDLYQVSRYYAEKVDIRLNIMEHLDDVYEQLSSITEVDITSSWAAGMEVTSKGGNKAEALSVIADMYDIDPDNIMTLGDNYNDISMLMWAGTGVAMGNADDRLKSIANHITAPNYEGGVAKAIYELVLKRPDNT